jgi:hypothetical protein
MLVGRQSVPTAGLVRCLPRLFWFSATQFQATLCWYKNETDVNFIYFLISPWALPFVDCSCFARATDMMMIFAAAAGTPRGIARVSKLDNLIGIQLADFIRASGQTNRTKRPDK